MHCFGTLIGTANDRIADFDGVFLGILVKPLHCGNFLKTSFYCQIQTDLTLKINVDSEILSRANMNMKEI